MQHKYFLRNSFFYFFPLCCALMYSNSVVKIKVEFHSFPIMSVKAETKFSQNMASMLDFKNIGPKSPGLSIDLLKFLL